MVLVCHMILKDHVIKGQVTLWKGAAQGKSPPRKYGGTVVHCGTRDIMVAVSGMIAKN